MSSEYAPITKELRSSCGSPYDMEAFVAIESHDFDNLCDNIDAIHSSLEHENKRLMEELNRVLSEQDADLCDYQRLPLDVDGKVWRYGDKLKLPDGNVVEVIGVSGDWLFYFADLELVTNVLCRTRAHDKRHYDTWESILADALGCEPHEVAKDDDLMALVERCKALAGEAEWTRCLQSSFSYAHSPTL